jgi:dipeptidyl aminopeptidase/acylaminoacyl peptidase
MNKLLFILLCFICLEGKAQDAIEYQTPPKAIYDLVTARLTPLVSFDDEGRYALIMERSAMPSLEDLAQPELRIAGMRINPNNFGPTRSSYVTGVSLKDIRSNAVFQISGLPASLKAGSFQWSKDNSRIAFTQTAGNAIDLYVIDIKARKAAKVNKLPLNILTADQFIWMNDNSLLYKTIVRTAAFAPKKPLAPKGPTVQQNLGKTAAGVTYQDLIKSPNDELQFEFYATAQLVRNNNGVEAKLGAPAIYDRMDVSPDEKYLLLKRIEKPYSYLVQEDDFNATMLLTDINGKQVKELAKIPSGELAPTGYDNALNAPHGFEWLEYQAATLAWIEPLDSGLIKKNVEFHDALYTLAAPFTASPSQLLKTPMRISGMSDVSESLMLVYERSRVKHKIKMSKLNLQTKQYDLLNDRSTDDSYNDIGAPVTDKNKYGRNAVKLVNSSKLFMRSAGSSPKGDMPFLSTFDINTKEQKILWRSADPYYESVVKILDFDKPVVITSRQGQTEQPNYYLKDLSAATTKQITDFPDPQPLLRGVTKQKITYKRKDGVDLAADLYLPKGYDAKKDGPLPVFMWAYPREFKNAADAAQIRGSNNTFIRVSSGSPIFWVTQGYAVMDNTEFPIVGEGDKQPNDNFIDQLTWNAEAAIDKIAEMGAGDRNRVAVGGHSYGAFMTANLLAHTGLFKAGIARSGAYNRTLTPFGFQNEERTYWQAPDVYNAMSPFMYADKIKTPLLLIHGEADNNSGTFPIQSERLYNAVKGHGGTIRYVQLPFEAHGYAAKENILHMLWEMNQWLEKYVKNAGK